MKNQKKEQKQKIWKIVAIAMIVVFAALLAGGLIKAHYIKSSFVKPTQTQIDYATKIAAEKLQSMGGNVSSFQIQAGRRMRILHDNGITRTIMQVSFYNNATTHTYLVDIDSGEILSHSETDTYIKLEEHQKKRYYGEHKYFEVK